MTLTVKNKQILPAKKYNPVNDLWIISCFYNSNAYKTKPQNFEKFIEQIEANNLNHLIVECAFDDQQYSLPLTRNVIRVRTPDIMWQKERLLNIALDNLPNKCKKVIWADCDVLFSNQDWAVETSKQLDFYKVVQPYKVAIRLPKYAEHYDGTGDLYYSFAYILQQNPVLLTKGKFDQHGHTGFAWASHKNILKKVGFYDVCIAGTADHLMAHSFAGDWDSGCVNHFFLNNPHFKNHYVAWSRKVYPLVKSSIGYVDGHLLHLWHGERKDRRYFERQQKLDRFGFNPFTDLSLNGSNCWKWSCDNDELKAWAKEYFVLRKED